MLSLEFLGPAELPARQPSLTSPFIFLWFSLLSCITFGINEECQILAFCLISWIFYYYINNNLLVCLVYKMLHVKALCGSDNVERVLWGEYQCASVNWCVLQSYWMKLGESPKDATSKTGKQGHHSNRDCWHRNHNICFYLPGI